MNVSKRNSMAYATRPRFGNYELVAKLGQGGFAEVYLGKHIYLQTLAAVKILRCELTEADVRKFLAEARLAARLNHSSIVQVRDFGLEGAVPFLVMDYAPNGTMRQHYPAGSRLAAKVILKYVEQIAVAVQYIHNDNLIHRDIKPENLLLGSGGTILLSDFGIAVAAHKAAASEQARVGTVAYMAPEQIEGYPCLASDQYALGVVVYEWLCGTRPFQGSMGKIIQQHLQVPPPSLRKSVPAIPRAVEKVVLRALAKEPEDRFESVQAFAAALRNAFEEKKKRSTRRRKVCKEIATFYAIDVLVGAAVGGVFSGLGVAPLLLEALLTLCMVLLPLVGAYVWRNRELSFLTWSIVVAAAVVALLSHSFVPFIVTYIGLLLFSLLTTYAVSVNGK